MIEKVMRQRAAHYRNTYGVCLAEIIEQLSAKGDACEICSKPISFVSPKVTARLDHCHSTGAVRGFLCNRCNQVLGMLGDNPEGVKRFLQYLSK